MKAEIEIRAGGAKHTLALPLGALEDIAKVNPVIEQLWQAFTLSVYQVDELVAVLAAGLKYGGSELTVEELIDEVGVKQAAAFAADALAAAIRDDAPKKAPAAKAKKPKRAS